MAEKRCSSYNGNAWDEHGNACSTCGGNGEVPE